MIIQFSPTVFIQDNNILSFEPSDQNIIEVIMQDKTIKHVFYGSKDEMTLWLDMIGEQIHPKIITS